MLENKPLTGYPSIDKPWLKYYSDSVDIPTVPSPDCSMISFLQQCNAARTSFTALNYFGTKISYKDLFEHIDQAAASLQKYGVKKGDFISLCGLNTPEFVYLLYAVNKIGAVSNWLGLTSPITDLRGQLASTESKLVFVIDLAYTKIKEASQGTQVEEIISVPLGESMPTAMRLLYGLKNKQTKSASLTWNKFLRIAGNEIPKYVMVTGNDLAMIEYTGGSTGVPKGVMLSNRNLNSYYINFNRTNNSGISYYLNADKYLACVPLFLAFGVSTSCHGPLSHGMELILAPDPNPDVLGKWILRSKPNHIAAGRVQIDGFAHVAKEARRDLSYIHSIMYGGEASDKNWEHKVQNILQKHQMKAPILNGYGMTECSACILVATTNTDEGLIPLGNVDVKVIDPDDPNMELGYDTEGELCLSSDTIMIGYFQNKEETEKAIFEENGQRWLRTQDLATITPDGTIHLTGRIKRIYHKLSPEKVDIRVYPMRIEESISGAEEIEKCAVIGVRDDITAYRTIAYLIPKADCKDLSGLKRTIEERCKANLPESHVPDEYVFISDFPLTRAGKVDYRALEKMAEDKVK